MNSPRIAMIVDHPLRDLPGLVLIARKLVSAGAKVYLVPMYAQESEVFALKPDLVLLNYLRKNNELFVSKLKACGIQYGVLDTEGGFYGDLQNYANVLSYQSDLYASMKFNLVWGQKMMSFWQKDFPHPHRLILTGLPRFDFYAQNFRNLDFGFLSDEFKQKPMILINTKVAIANPLFISVEKEIELYRKLGVSDSKIQFYLEFGRLSIKDTIQLGHELSQDFPASQIVVRPHPHENHETYEKAFTDSRDVQVRKEGPVTPWILQSKAVIHRHCTTAIEAALAGKPAIAPQWVRTSAEAPDAEAISFKPTSREEMNELLSSALKNNSTEQPASIKQELERIIDTWLYQMDGQSHQRASNAILENLGPRKVDEDKCRHFLYGRFSPRKDLVGKSYHLLNRLSGQTHPFLLWKLEKMRLKKWAGSQKYYTPKDCHLWSAPLDKNEAESISYKWCVDQNEYEDQYPGYCVVVERLS